MTNRQDDSGRRLLELAAEWDHRAAITGVDSEMAVYRECAEELTRALSPQGSEPAGVGDREFLGKLVRMEWMDWAREQPAPKSSWLTPWDQLTEPEREVDRRIGERIYNMAVGALATPAPAQQAFPTYEFLALLMCSDPWPVENTGCGTGQDALVALADRESQRLGFTDWIDAFHHLQGPLNTTAQGASDA